MSSPLSENITKIVKSSATSVIGPTRGTKTSSYQQAPLTRRRHDAGRQAGKERQAEVDGDRAGDLGDRDVDNRACQAEQRGQHRQET